MTSSFIFKFVLIISVYSIFTNEETVEGIHVSMGMCTEWSNACLDSETGKGRSEMADSKYKHVNLSDMHE